MTLMPEICIEGVCVHTCVVEAVQDSGWALCLLTGFLWNAESSPSIYSLFTKSCHFFYIPKRICLTSSSTNPEKKGNSFLPVTNSHNLYVS